MTEHVTPVSDAIRRFAEEYLIDFKVAAAADRAGISTAAGYQAMQDFRVRALINEGKRKASERVAISVDNVLENLRVLAGAVTVADFIEEYSPDPLDPSKMRERLKPVSKWTDEMRKAVKSLKWTKFGPQLELYDAMAATVHIGKFYGMFKDGIELSAPGGKPLEMITGTMTPQEAAERYMATIGK